MSEPGRLGEEAVKLLETLQQWGRHTFGGAEQHDAGGSHIATGAPECAYCPICQLIGLLRGERPDLGEKLAEAGAAMAAAMRSFVDAASASTPDDRQQPAQPASGEPRVQRIDLDGPGD